MAFEPTKTWFLPENKASDEVDERSWADRIEAEHRRAFAAAFEDTRTG